MQLVLLIIMEPTKKMFAEASSSKVDVGGKKRRVAGRAGQHYFEISSLINVSGSFRFRRYGTFFPNCLCARGLTVVTTWEFAVFPSRYVEFLL